MSSTSLYKGQSVNVPGPDGRPVHATVRHPHGVSIGVQVGQSTRWFPRHHVTPAPGRADR